MSVSSLIPPSYGVEGVLSSESLLATEFAQSSTSLPSYTPGIVPARQQTEHVVSLTVSEKNSHEWLKLKVKSWASPGHLPSFVEGTPITGTVELDLRKYDNIKAITVSLKGSVVSSGIDQRQFMGYSETLWENSMGDPRRPGEPGQPSYSDKLIGLYSFPFNLPIPKKVNSADKQHLKDLRLTTDDNLPPNLSGRAWGSSINYELCVEVKRRGILSVGSTAKTLFGYTPVTRPEPLSSLMQEAYRDGRPILGPEADLHSWEVFSGLKIEGTVFNARKVTAGCDLAMAKPLAYTRGSFIPCFLTIQCDDEQALRLVSQPDAPVLLIKRKTKARVGVEDSGAALILPGNEDNKYLVKAAWMRVGEVASGRCMFYGELALPSDLVPSFQFGNFDIKYVVDMQSFSISGFVPDSDARVFRSEVAIKAAYAFGQRPKPRLPPGYTTGPPGPVVGTEASRRMMRMDMFA